MKHANIYIIKRRLNIYLVSTQYNTRASVVKQDYLWCPCVRSCCCANRTCPPGSVLCTSGSHFLSVPRRPSAGLWLNPDRNKACVLHSVTLIQQQNYTDCSHIQGLRPLIYSITEGLIQEQKENRRQAEIWKMSVIHSKHGKTATARLPSLAELPF